MKMLPSRTRMPTLILVALSLTPGLAHAAADPAGAEIYRNRCASCHGASGEGTQESYPHPLAGKRSVEQLARLIAKTMPEDDPGTCVGPDADAVARYIHESFYSKRVEGQSQRARVELARLTNRQYRNAVADLIGTFEGEGYWGDERGLKAEYFRSRRFRKENRVIERVDPEVRFAWKGGTPDDQIPKEEFGVVWNGSVFAPETGEYEFIVKTTESARFWLNGDDGRPFIDASVKSGDQDEYTASIPLVGGRAYPLRLEYFKSKDQKDDRERTISLLWKRPHRTPDVIPQRFLSTAWAPDVYVVTTPFPPDDRSVGYERGSAISREWDQATTDAALETAAFVADRIDRLAKTKRDDGDRRDKLVAFARRFAERAFRRPLTDELAQAYVLRHFDEAPDPDAAVKRAVILVLKSPRFLYADPTPGPGDAHDTASRLAWFLWDSLPDAKLLDAARDNRLQTPEQIAEQIDRMQRDLRYRAKLRDFLMVWLKVDPAPELAKDPAQFPGFNPAIASDLRTSLELLLDDVTETPEADYRRLFTTRDIWLNGRLAALYGASLPSDAPFQKVELDQARSAGVLTHPYLMSTFAYTASSSPIHRGIFLARSVLGRALRPPPEAVAPLPVDLHPDLTTRERVSLQTQAEACQACHTLINPLGFTLENFDAIGRYRDQDRDRPVDASGQYQDLGGQVATFAGPRSLADYITSSPEAHAAFAEQLFHHLVKQPVLAYGSSTLPELRDAFAADGFHLHRLARAIALRAVRPPADQTPATSPAPGASAAGS